MFAKPHPSCTPGRRLKQHRMPPRKRARSAVDTAAADTAALITLPATATEHSAELLAIYESGELCDGTVTLGDRQFPVCRMLLSAASPFFKSAFLGGFRESVQCSVTLDPTLPPDCVEALLRHAHAPVGGGGVTLDPESFLGTADQLGFSHLLPAASCALMETLSPGNVLARLVLADRYELGDLLESGIDLFSEHAVSLCGSAEFASLPQGLLAKMLSHQENTASEQALWLGLLAWTRHDAARAPAFEPLLEHLRLPELGMQYLIESVVHAEEVLRSARAQTLVQMAMAFLTVPEQRLALASPRMEPRQGCLPAFGSKGGIDVTRAGRATILRLCSFDAQSNSEHVALSSETFQASRLCWTVRVIKGRDLDGHLHQGRSTYKAGWVCLGVIADPDPDSHSYEQAYAWGGQLGQVYAGGETDYERGGWVAWRTDDTAKMILDVVAGTLSLEHTRGGVVSQYQLDGLDPTKDWRLYVNFCGIGSSVELM